MDSSKNGFLELVPIRKTSHEDGHLVHVPKLSILFDKFNLVLGQLNSLKETLRKYCLIREAY